MRHALLSPVASMQPADRLIVVPHPPMVIKITF
jgi:hypothetical protein